MLKLGIHSLITDFPLAVKQTVAEYQLEKAQPKKLLVNQQSDLNPISNASTIASDNMSCYDAQPVSDERLMVDLSVSLMPAKLYEEEDIWFEGRPRIFSNWPLFSIQSNHNVVKQNFVAIYSIHSTPLQSFYLHWISAVVKMVFIRFLKASSYF